MENLEVIISLEIIINSLLLSLWGSSIRILLSELGGFMDTVKMFIGSIIFGTLAGFTLNDFESLIPYNKFIIIIVAIFSKEVYFHLSMIVTNPKKGIKYLMDVIKTVKK